MIATALEAKAAQFGTPSHQGAANSGALVEALDELAGDRQPAAPAGAAG